MNKVELSGHLGKDPNMFYTPGGKACTKFSLAVDSSYGGVKKDPDWFNVTCWGELAEEVNETIKKGSFVNVKGSVRVSKYKSKKLIEQMVDAKVPRERAEEIAIATWYEISAHTVDNPASKSSGKSSEDIEIFDEDEGGPF
jgi:single stranded DNA-binding protein